MLYSIKVLGFAFPPTHIDLSNF